MIQINLDSTFITPTPTTLLILMNRKSQSVRIIEPENPPSKPIPLTVFRNSFCRKASTIAINPVHVWTADRNGSPTQTISQTNFLPLTTPTLFFLPKVIEKKENTYVQK